jgi:hypothetical protein
MLTEDDLGLVLVLGSEECPYRRELSSGVSFSPFASPESAHVGIGRTALSDDPAVPPCIVVQVNHDVRPGGQGCLDKVVELSKEARGEGGRGLVVTNQSLPVDRKSDTMAPGQNDHDPAR